MDRSSAVCGELARSDHFADATRRLCVLTPQADSPVDQAAAISDLAAIAAASANCDSEFVVQLAVHRRNERLKQFRMASGKPSMNSHPMV